MTTTQARESREGKNPGISGGIVRSPVTLRLAGAATPNFTDNGGLVLQNVHVQLVFWGSAWGSSGNLPAIGDVANAVISILSGPYMHSLDQYRSIGNGVLNGTTLVITPVANCPASPPNPFAESDVQALVSNLINAGMMPGPASNSQLLYCVVMPPGVNFTNGGVIGEHSYLGLGGQNVHYAWITNGGTLASVTTIFSHELVESCTDPEGSAILGTAGTCSGGGWCEIGDVCEGVNGVVDGITVQSYWSQQDGSCVVPTEKTIKDGKDHKDTKDHKDHKEFKDQKEKDKDAKEKDKDRDAKDADTIDQLAATVGQLSHRVDELAQQLASGQAFIRPEERPQVGEQALKRAQETEG